MSEAGGSAANRPHRILALVVASAIVAAACSGGGGSDITLRDDATSSAAEEDAGAESTDTDADAEDDEDRNTELETDDGGDQPATDVRLEGVAPPIRVDQFGYRPGDTKVAVIADPEVGFDAAIDIEVGDTIEVRRVDDDRVVYSGAPEPWGDGEVHEQSGDRGWWFDFSSVQTRGTYYVVDPSTEHRSGPFDIDPDVYDDVLDAALRMFWFNRANIDHPEELAGPWNDGPAFVGPNQDTEARSVDARDDADTTRDLSGGWFDAGDPNKYVTFAAEPVHGLLTIYRRFPELFGDDLQITESGNGIPDIVDEIKWETDWLEKMQLDDGSVLIKVGLLGYESDLIPSQSPEPRFYEEACSSSTITAAGMFANAALVFSQIPALADDAVRLRDRAIAAWDWYQANPIQEDCDPTAVKAGDADVDAETQEQDETVAAIYLFALTGAREYHTRVIEHYDTTLPFDGEGFGHYGPDQADALLYYRTLPDADPAVVDAIDARIADLADWSTMVGFDPTADLYRSFMPDYMYHWGSNRVKANSGASNLLVGGIDGGQERATAHLNFFHGVNPLGLVYLSNMEGLGAERSAEHLFHHWFGDRSMFDVNRNPDIGVPPGFVLGGPNTFYSGDTFPPAGQPVQKSYADWAAYGEDPSWEITEPAIYYQSAYLRLLASVIASS